MDPNFTIEDKAIRERARAFTEAVLYPLELIVEKDEGLVPAEWARLRDGVLRHGMNAVNHGKEDGGQGMTVVQQAIVNEEIGKATGNLYVLVWVPPYPLRNATPEQKRKYLYPACQGLLRDAFLVSEPGAGSDAGSIRTSAVMRNGKYYLSGEKCFASGSDIADYCLVHANLDGDPRKATLFIVDPRAKGFRITRLPKAMGKSARGHPEVTLDNVEVDPSDVLGEVGQGFELTKDWFVEARVYIGARCVGQAIRAAEIANEWAATRVQFGRPIRDFQAIEFMLADMAVEIMAAKSMLYRVAAEIDGGLERKAAHARVSAVKLFSSEMSGRVVDKALQILGGRGYFNDSAVERLYRATRVERIVEGTSEIQRVIIGGQIKKRGLALYTD
jgi:alkylation response protein AidB-like acyl-CoA dehydrogenase